MSAIWLLKTEPDTFSINDLQACPGGTSGWDGDLDSGGFDNRSSREEPRWYQVDIRYLCTYPQPLSLKTLRQYAEFADMELVVRPRLSVQKVTERQFQRIQQLCMPESASA